MKYTSIFAVLCLALIAGAAAAQLELETEFAEWKVRHGRVYETEEEHMKGMLTYLNNKERVKELNRLHEDAIFHIDTPFADLSEDEFRAKMLTLKLDTSMRERIGEQERFPQWALADVPDHKDWREDGVVGAVKNQGQCGSCWAFSTIGSVEPAYHIKHGKAVVLSEQELVSCSHDCINIRDTKGCNAGCNGGLMPAGFEYLMKHGSMLEADYPYTASNGQCMANDTAAVVHVQNYTMVADDHDQVKAALASHGPLSIAVDAGTWQFYFGGVLSHLCGEKLDHGVTLVGYSAKSTDHKPYWIIRNSWGPSWGEHGYIRVEIKKDLCGVTKFVSRPTVN